MGFYADKETNISVYLDKNENSAVKIAAENFVKDVNAVCGASAAVTEDPGNACIYALTVECDTVDGLKSAFEKNALSSTGSLITASLGACAKKLFDTEGKLIWEAYSVLVSNGKLFVCGARRRGTIYGLYELSSMFGVSPWYWFADVPVRKKQSISLPEGFTKYDHPSVKYRGVFINDEEELEAWAQKYFNADTIGPAAYEKIFELLLRLKGNYIWPAMHVNAFNTDPENGRLADRMGITVGTSHCDMLLRSNQNEWEPWKKENGCEDAEYDYSIEGENREIIKKYWTGSLLQNKGFDVCYTVGMRGIHDSGFITKKITENSGLSDEQIKAEKIKLLEKVINDQIGLIEEYGEKDAPRIFVPYKEVMNLYDAGLKVPEDITLIWVNDNFGYMRRYPNEEERKRPGGNGLYYHISYWARPGMSWLFYNSMPFAHIKNELCKAYENGIRRLWVFNVGAIKPLEPDIEFCLTYAWEIGREETRTADTTEFIKRFMNSNFTGASGSEAADIFETFLQTANVRKVEHMRSDVFSQTAFGNEAARFLNRMKGLFERTLALYEKIQEDERDAFLELFAVRIFAAYFIYASYYYADRSRLMYDKGDFEEAERDVNKSRSFDEFKRRLLYCYNRVMCGGKWDRILTPEEFRPPVTALYPAGKPALVLDGEKKTADNSITEASGKRSCDVPAVLSPEKGFYESDGVVSMLAEHYESNTGFKVIKHLGRFEGCLLEAVGGNVEYRFTTVSAGRYLLELYRFPSLNSVGRIRFGISLDGKEAGVLESGINDEWRGDWRHTVMNNVEKMYLELPYTEPGTHVLSVNTIDRYAAFSKLVIYTDGYIPSNLGPCESAHAFYNTDPLREEASFEPDTDALDRLTGELFGCKKAPLPDVIVCDKIFWKNNYTYLKNTVVKQERSGIAKYAPGPGGRKNVFEKFGSGVFAEKNGRLAFGTEYALENSENAYMLASANGIGFEHTNSESDGRTGLAMYVPGFEVYFDEGDEPSLNYRIETTGGRYNIWLLIKYDDERNARIGIAIDGTEIPQEEMFGHGRLFNYGTKQNWIWMIVAVADIRQGRHVFSLRAKASEFKIDRVYLTKTEEWPPVDADFTETGRE